MAAQTELQIIITAINNAGKDISKLKTDLDAIAKALGLQAQGQHQSNEKTREQLNLLPRLNQLWNQLGNAVRFATGGFLAYKGVQIAKDILDTAARAETLGVVLNIVGRNAGYTRVQLADVDAQVRKLGITSSAARESLARLIQSNLPISFAPQLARAAQDLAVVAGTDSSQTFDRLVTAIQTQNTQMLRNMGIIIDRERVIQEATARTGKSLDQQTKQLVFANAVMAESAKLAGSYAAAMNTAGKAITSLPRLITDLKESLGRDLLPVYFSVIDGTAKLLKALNELAAGFGEQEKNANLFGISTAQGYSALAGAIDKVVAALISVIKWAKENWSWFKFIAIAVGVLVALIPIFIGVMSAVALVGGKVVLIAAAVVAGFGLLAGAVSVVLDAFKKFREEGASVGSVIEGSLSLLEKIIPKWSLWGLAIRTVAAALDLINGKSEEQNKKQKDANDLINDYLRLNRQAQGSLQRLQTATDVQKDAVAEVARASTDDERAQANANLERANREIQRIRKEIDDAAVEAGKIEDQLRKMDLDDDQVQTLNRIQVEQAKFIANLNVSAKLMDSVISAFTAAGLDFGRFSAGVTKTFSDQFNAVEVGARNVAELVKRGQIDAKASVRELAVIFNQLAASVTTPAELKKLQDLRQQVVSAGVDPKAVDAAVAQAVESQRIIDETLKVGGEKALAALRARFDNDTKLRQQKLEASQRLEQLHADEVLRIQQAGYDKGLVNLDEYFALRVATTEAQTTREIALLTAQIKAAQDKLKFDRSRLTESQIAEALRNIADLENRRAEAGIKGSQAVAAVLREESQARERLRQQVAAARDELDRLEGREAVVAQREIARWIQTQLDLAIQMAEGPEREAFIILLDKITAHKQINAQLDIEAAKLQRSLEIQRLDLDLREARLRAAQRRGEATDIEAQNEVNDITRERIDLVNKQIAAEQARLDQLRRASGGQITPQIQTSEAQLRKLGKEMIDLQNQIVTIGDRIREGFTNSLAQGLEDLVNRAKNLKEVFKSILDDVGRQITAIASREIAQQAVRGLVAATGGDNGIFGAIGRLFGDDANKLGGSPQRAMWVRDAAKGVGALTPSTTEAAAGKEAEEAAKRAAEAPTPAGLPAGSVSVYNTPTNPLNVRIVDGGLLPGDENKNKEVLEQLGGPDEEEVLAELPEQLGGPEFFPEKPVEEEQLGLRQQLATMFEDFKKFARDTWQSIRDFASETWDTISNFASETWDEITEFAGEVWDNVASFANTSLDELESAWSEVSDLGEDAWTQITDAGSTAWDSITSFASSSWDSITQIASQAWDFISSVVSQVMQSLSSNSGGMFESAGGLFDSIAGFFGGGSAASSSGAVVGADQIAGMFLEKGGYIPGPSHAQGGVPIEAEGGEFIINKKQTSRFMHILRAINEDKIKPEEFQIRKFAEGGQVPTAAAANDAGQTIADARAVAKVVPIIAENIHRTFNVDKHQRIDHHQSVSEDKKRFVTENASFFSMMRSFASRFLHSETLSRITREIHEMLPQAKFEEGGVAVGPSHAQGGIPIEVEGGEFIVNKVQTTKYLPLLRAINDDVIDGFEIPRPKFAMGGLVGEAMAADAVPSSRMGGANSGQRPPAINVTIQTPDIDSFRKSRDMVAAEMGVATQRALRRVR